MQLYRFLAEDGMSAFRQEVSAALNAGWDLHGSLSYAFDTAGGVKRCGQAVVKEVAGEHSADVNPGAQ